MFIVGLTGGIATGKSTVSGILTDLGCEIIDADQVAREVVRPGKPAWSRIKLEFGESVFLDNGELDRDRLGQIIFTDTQKRQLVNRIVHPEVQKTIIFRLLKFFITGHKYIILDVPLLFESGKMLSFMAATVVVKCMDEQQITRLMARNSLTQAEALQRIGSQMSLEEKSKRATYVIDNSGTIADTELQVKKLYRTIESSNVHWRIRVAVVSCLAAVIALVSYILK
ncbi:hypothetical protein ScPMuIL_016291 [Solemya velum]